MQTLRPTPDPPGQNQHVHKTLRVHITAEEALPGDVSQGPHFAGGDTGPEWQRNSPKVTQLMWASALTKASKSGSRAFFPVHFMSSRVRGTNASSTSVAVTSFPATGRWLASALDACVRSRLPLVRGTLLLIKNLSGT